VAIKFFKTMKKQILLITFFVLALFAGTLTTYGQAVHVSTPRGINCTDDALHPIAGKAYTYQAGSNQTGNYTFWATKDPNFITTSGSTTTYNINTKLASPTTTPTGTDLLATSANYATAGVDTVGITWSDAILSGTTTAAPTFVAVLKDGTCSNNFNAWAIQPIKAFTVDIRNIDNAAPTVPLAFDATENQCMDVVRGATWNGTAMQYNFGTQILYYEVIAANFSTSWTPTFTLAGLGNGQTAVIEWAYTNAFASPVTVTSGTPSGTPVTTAATNTNNGVSIWVRVTITNNTFEGTAATPVTLTVDGQNSVGDWDIENNTLSNAGPLCNPTTGADGMDAATQTLNPRPTVTPTTPTPFVPGNQTN
jgi:hypothetical protein